MMKLRQNSSGAFTEKEFQEAMTKTLSVYEKLQTSTEYQDSLGWRSPEKWASPKALEKLLQLSDSMDEDGVLVLIGVGGSNNGARAAIKALKGKREVVYSGNNLSADYYQDLLQSLQGKSVYINVIAKNFETLEPGLSFRIFRRYLKERYGDTYHNRIFVTGTPGSQLHQLCEKHDFTFLTFPEDVGGRFSVLSDVGLFPMAFAGIDIRSMVQGALDMKISLDEVSPKNLALIYATTRHLLYQKGYAMEMLAMFEPRLEYFSKWWIQLFAESEGKEGKGLYPVASSYSEDLHSIGQFVQDGKKIIFETFIEVEDPVSHMDHYSDDVEDGFDYLNGKSLTQINRAAYEATVLAHKEEGIPEIFMTIPKIDAYYLGQLFYFFELSVYISGKLLKINPFDQPGVESYKKHMFKNLGKTK